MALFGKNKKEEARPNHDSTGAESGSHPVLAREDFCRICNKRQNFTNVWLRTAPMTTCPCCGTVFDDPQALYKKNQPKCPQCDEPLESPGFEYGICDGCGSKYELVDNAVPGMLPNKQQRDEMNKYGKAWSKD